MLSSTLLLQVLVKGVKFRNTEDFFFSLTDKTIILFVAFLFKNPDNDVKEHRSSVKRDHSNKKLLWLPMTTVCSSVRDLLPGVW